MSKDAIEQLFDLLKGRFHEAVCAIAGEVINEKLPAALARQLRAVERADTDEERELRRLCALEYLTKREAALFLNVSESHIDNLIADDPTFPIHKVGNKNVRLRRVELIEWTREQGRRRLRAEGYKKVRNRPAPGHRIRALLPYDGCNPERNGSNGSLSKRQKEP